MSSHLKSPHVQTGLVSLVKRPTSPRTVTGDYSSRAYVDVDHYSCLFIDIILELLAHDPLSMLLGSKYRRDIPTGEVPSGPFRTGPFHLLTGEFPSWHVRTGPCHYPPPHLKHLRLRNIQPRVKRKGKEWTRRENKSSKINGLQWAWGKWWVESYVSYS